MNGNGSELLKFPCDFIIKIFGYATEEFEKAALTIVHKHVPNIAENALQLRLSKNGKYLAISVTVHVESKEQLDNIYRDLSSSPQILMAI
jgi:uncharacterized protein